MYEDFGNDLPLFEEHLRVVREKYRLLVESISLKDGLLDDMMSELCITLQQKLAISEMRLFLVETECFLHSSFICTCKAGVNAVLTEK